jgi:hypothetical protein
MKRVTFSVRQIEALLANQINRTLSVRWQTLADEMRNGRWNPDIAPIIQYDDGQLADGQHRLRAALEIGKPFTCWVVVIPRGDITKVDAGRARVTRDHCRILGNGIGNRQISAGRMLWWLKRNIWHSNPAPSHESVIDLVKEYDLTSLPEISSELSGQSQLIACWGFVRKHLPKEADNFFGAVNLGEMISSSEVSFTLRKRLLATAPTGNRYQTFYLYCVVRSWNAYISGESLARVIVPARVEAITPILKVGP